MDYLLKSSAILGIFYVFYKLILQKETFFQSNRIFLLIGLISAFTLPLIVIPIYVEQTVLSLENFTFNNIAETIELQKSIDWNQILLLTYLIGTLFFIGKFLLSLLSLGKMLITNPKDKIGDFYFIKSDGISSPFSFFNYIVYNPDNFKQQDLQYIISHEKVHAYQWHSIDVLFSQIITIIFWFNPFAWLYKKELQQNLEYIADNISQEKASCEKSYQELLLKTSISKNQLAFTNYFYNSLIKKRIIMLHKNRSNKTNQWKFALILPLIIAFIFTFNTKIIAQVTEVEEVVEVVEEMIEVVEEIEVNRLIEVVEVVDIHETEEAFIITKNTNDFDAIKKSLSEYGMTAKFSNIKRNSKGEIVKITIKLSNKNSKASASWNNPNNPIPNITVGEINNRLVVSSSHSNETDFHFVTKDGNHTIHTNGKGTSNFVFYSDKGDKHNEHQVLEIKSKDGVFIIKKDGNHTIHTNENKTSNFIYISEDNKKIHKGHQLVEIKEGNGVYKVYKDGKVEVIEFKGDDNHTLIEIITDDSNGNHNGVFFSDTDGSNPIYYIDGKLSTKKDLENLGSDKIQSMSILKGSSAIEKYGEKAKDGVILIITKKK